MPRLGLRRVLSTTLVLGICLPALAGPGGAQAGSRQLAAPPGIDLAHPAVTGRLVARPIPGQGINRSVICGDQARSAAVRAVTINRGLVICTDEGRLVLLQLAGVTRYFNRAWNGMTVAQMTDGDRINAWGVFNGVVLNPTSVVQDTTKPESQRQTVSGTLVAKPLGGVGTGGPFICGDQDRTAEARALMVNRGLVICTEEGRLVLLQLSAATRIFGRDGLAVTVADLTVRDHIVATGILIDGGRALYPTFTVEDTDIQTRDTNSQDYITEHDPNLVLDVLSSDTGGPVMGIVRADRGPDTRVNLCNGRAGIWSSLHVGMTIDISSSIFNRRIMTYVDSETVRVVSCP